MTNARLYLSIGLPTLAVLIGILVNGIIVQQLSARMTSLEGSFNGRLSSFENALTARINSIEARLETLIGKVIEIDNRLTRVEERLEHLR